MRCRADFSPKRKADLIEKDILVQNASDYIDPLTDKTTHLQGERLKVAIAELRVINKDVWNTTDTIRKAYIREIIFYYCQYINLQTNEIEQTKSPHNMVYLVWLSKACNAEQLVDLTTKLPARDGTVNPTQSAKEFMLELWSRIKPYERDTKKEYKDAGISLLIANVLKSKVCTKARIEQLQTRRGSITFQWSDNCGRPLNEIKTFKKVKKDEDLTHSSETRSPHL